MTGEVLADQLNWTLCCTGVMAAPLPVATSTNGVVEELVVKDTLAVDDPVACGSKVRVNATVVPG